MSADVVTFPEREPDGYTSGTAKCVSCAHEWVQVAETGDDWFECPSCKTHMGRRKYPCGPGEGEERWVCKCGCDVLFATPTALRCCGCGTSQQPFD